MFSDVIPYPKIPLPLYKIKRGSDLSTHFGILVYGKGKKKKKSQNRVQIIYSIFHSVMFLKQRQNTYNYTLWTLFGDNIKNLNLRPSKEY